MRSLNLKLVAVCALALIAFSCKDSKKEQTPEVKSKLDETPKIVSHLFTQTNQTDNAVIHYRQNPNGTLTEIERVATKGKGTNGFKAVTGETSAPDPLFSASSVILSNDNKYLFVANSGDNSVSAFTINNQGKLKLIDQQSTGETGYTNSLAISNNGKTLYVLHSFGPNHIKVFNVNNGKLTLTNQSYSVNTKTATDRIPTQINVTPDGENVLVNVILNARPKPGDNGPILVPSNIKEKDGVVMFGIAEDGSLKDRQIMDSGAPTPFSLRFLNNGTNNFINTFAAANGAALSKFENGKIVTYPVTAVNLELAPKGPSETCWVAISGDKKYAFATSFGLGTVTSFEILNDGLKIIKDGQATTTGGNGFAALAGIPTTGPCDNYMKEDYFYQLHGNAGKLIAYKNDKGILTQIEEYKVPLNSVQGLTGF